jgi:hypothetical protein
VQNGLRFCNDHYFPTELAGEIGAQFGVATSHTTGNMIRRGLRLKCRLPRPNHIRLADHAAVRIAFREKMLFLPEALMRIHFPDRSRMIFGHDKG